MHVLDLHLDVILQFPGRQSTITAPNGGAHPWVEPLYEAAWR